MRTSQMTLDDDRVQALDHAVPTNPGVGSRFNSPCKAPRWGSGGYPHTGHMHRLNKTKTL